MPGAAIEMKADTREIQALYADLRKAKSGLTVQLRREMKAAAEPMRQAVRSAGSFSSRIPAAVKVKASFSARKTSMSIYVDAAKAPEAAPINHKGQGGQFRHMVYGHRDRWALQRAVPFFDGPVRAHQDATDKAMARVVDTISKQAGFR